MWAIWENRNRKWNKLSIMNGVQPLTWIFSAYPASNLIGDTVVIPDAVPTPIMKQWQTPEIGSICVNCDAAMNKNSTGVGIGFIWRTWEGKILSAGMIYLSSICTVEMAEVWAILEAIKRPPAAATDPIEIQSDCKSVVEEIKNQGHYFSAVSTILHQIKVQMEAFHCVNIIHVKRTNNILARKCLADRTTQFFDHSFPGWLANFCKADCLILV
uniref:RNase H type-1 domain-containing protein n=2 Tax=Cannabis sativa TaxID=3483 RepID=A0A803P8T4_CANSA